MGQTWKEFCASLNKVANKAAVKIEELSDTASLHIKAKSIDVKLCEAFEKLGRLYYGQLDGEVGKADEIDACVKEIDRLKRELGDINEQIEQIDRDCYNLSVGVASDMETIRALRKKMKLDPTSNKRKNEA